MIYIVSGYMRTGTSMMMRALEAGGLDAVKNPTREKMNDQYGDKDYKPNPGGFYELQRREYMQFGFPRMYEGKLIKCLHGGLWRMVVGDYKIVFMMRDTEEIRQSYEAFFGNKLPPTFEKYEEIMQDSIDMLKNRLDTQIDVFQYREVIKDPMKHFNTLKNQGWPIDTDKAISVIDPSLLRFKREDLTIGI